MAVTEEFVRCSKCQAELPPAAYNLAEPVPCPTCGSAIRTLTFPALYRKAGTFGAGETLVDTAEASCFYHAEKRAEKTCDHCGRFICGLCEVSLQGRCLCPQCLGTSQEKGELQLLTKERYLYDNIALTLAILPLLFTWPSIIGSPAALYVVFRYWKTPLGLLKPRRRWRYIVAAILASLQIIGWAILLFVIIQGANAN